MAKKAPPEMIDAALDYMAQANIMHVCSSEPATYGAIAGVSLASVAVTPVTDFTKANGDVSGRKATVAAKSGVNVSTTGSATHIVLARTTDSTLRYITTCTNQSLTAGNTVNIPAWKAEIQAPS